MSKARVIDLTERDFVRAAKRITRMWQRTRSVDLTAAEVAKIVARAVTLERQRHQVSRLRTGHAPCYACTAALKGPPR